MFKRILVATDGSNLAKKAVRGGIDLAASTGAELVVLHVVPRYPVSYFEGGVTISNADVARVEKEWAAHGQAMVDAASELAGREGVKAKAVIVKSDLVAESLAAAARKHKCDLIVMASHGRKGLKRILLGSETLQLLTHSTIPVLVLR